MALGEKSNTYGVTFYSTYIRPGEGAGTYSTIPFYTSRGHPKLRMDTSVDAKAGGSVVIRF